MPVSDFTPTVDEVGALMFARAHGEYDTLTTFTEDTKPTADQVTDTIGRAVGLVAASVGSDLDAEFHSAAKTLVTLMTALLIEPGHFPDQARPEKSAWDQWRELYKDSLAALVAAIKRKASGGDSSPSDDVPSTTYLFPPAQPVVPW